ncbi:MULTISPECIES: receptor-recognizing protein [Enterobacter cloacae complex]|uniref:receptor-recognizing protein n=1 Tax=Enterobacter cloacae complex TaxID=354276 RepID=UPI001A8FD508|nr:receptor-recognizing protein [Enterobacter hormaechei]QSS37297.1 receptor-recognizing protein [Enterobacter hormaechei]
MPIVGVPGWIGSSAVSVTGQRWMSAARTAVQLSAAGNMSQLAGCSKEIHYSIGANHNYNKDTLINYLKSQGSTPVVVTITGDLVSFSSGVPCLDFPSSLTNSYISLVINAGVTVYGRGGNGGVKGGGGNSADGGMGGGGRPFGVANTTRPPASGSRAATSGTLTAAGIGAQYLIGTTAVQYTCGSGGNVGAAGAAATGRLGTMYGGGAAGKAVTGNVPTWTKVGAIYGARV